MGYGDILRGMSFHGTETPEESEAKDAILRKEERFTPDEVLPTDLGEFSRLNSSIYSELRTSNPSQTRISLKIPRNLSSQFQLLSPRQPVAHLSLPSPRTVPSPLLSALLPYHLLVNPSPQPPRPSVVPLSNPLSQLPSVQLAVLCPPLLSSPPLRPFSPAPQILQPLDPLSNPPSLPLAQTRPSPNPPLPLAPVPLS